MDRWPKWIKIAILILFYGVAIALICRGITAVAGVPLGIAGIALQRSMRIDID